MLLATVIAAGVVSPSTSVRAERGAADSFIDSLAEAAGTPALNWVGCGGGFQCATAEVPLNYHYPNGQQIDLAVIRLPATDPGHRIGTLFVNFGGPGQSGVNRLRDRARWPWLFSDELRSRFDLVSWDPRGVSRSAGVNCFASVAEQTRYFAGAPGMPMDAEGEQRLFSWAGEFAERCAQHAGPVVNHASSANSARDLELLRRAVGDPGLTYHGISYGSQLGAIYANLFPGRVRAMVLDGSLDFEGNVDGHGSEGATIPLDARQGVGTALAATFDAFLGDCAAAGPRCAFSPGDPRAKWAALAARAADAPLTTVDGHRWTYPEIVSNTLARPTAYPKLAELLQQISDTGTAAPELLNELTASDPLPPETGSAPYLANREDAYSATQCSDSTVPTDPGAYSRAARDADRSNPDFGRIAVFDTVPCAFWQARDADRYTGPWNRSTSAPILVLNARNDPATPLEGAYAGASQLAQALVVVIEGTGHTSMYVASTCAERVKRDYLFSGVLPPAGTGCSRDHSAFD